jgi:hypothetical protein
MGLPGLGSLAVAALLLGCKPPPHTFVADPVAPATTVAILPLANYTATRDAPDRVQPMLAVQLAWQRGIRVVDPGAVEAAVAREPWLMMDRLPPDLVDRFGNELGADALLVGSILTYGTRDVAGERIPQFSLSLRLLAVPGGRVLWTAVHSRDGNDGEWLFGMGRVSNLEQLVSESVKEIVATLPENIATGGSSSEKLAGDTGK